MIEAKKQQQVMEWRHKELNLLPINSPSPFKILSIYL